jgi:hypothetical protein
MRVYPNPNNTLSPFWIPCTVNPLLEEASSLYEETQLEVYSSLEHWIVGHEESNGHEPPVYVDQWKLNGI